MADNPTTLPLDPRLQASLMDLMDASVNRARSQEPIHNAAMAMAAHMAPGYAQSAMGPLKPRTDPNTIKPLKGGTGSNDNGPGGTSSLLAGLLSALAMGGPGAGGNLGKLIQDLIKLFQHGGRDTVQGNKPFGGGALTGPQNPADVMHFLGSRRTRARRRTVRSGTWRRIPRSRIRTTSSTIRPFSIHSRSGRPIRVTAPALGRAWPRSMAAAAASGTGSIPTRNS
jgi:hypothetical protein